VAKAQIQPLSSDAKAPPHSNEAEQCLLGALMLAASTWDQVADQLDEGDFYRNNHRLIFRAISSLCESGQPCDAITIADWFARHGKLDQVDNGAYLTMLANETPGPSNVLGYATIIRERSILRQMIEVGTRIADDALASSGRGSKELLEEAEKRIYAIADQGSRRQSSYVEVQKVMAGAMDLLNELQEHEGELTGVPTGFAELDKATAGLQATDLIILAARPSMGKTALAMNIAERAAIRHKVPVAIFSMEMSDIQLVMRLFSSLGQINQQKLRSGSLDDRDWINLRSAMSLLKGASIFIDQTPSLSPLDLRARARRMKREHDIGLIVIDYLQLMKVPGFGENRTQEISEISRSLKALAKELKVPVVALSQLNRALEQRPDKRPRMADLRESGAIEQDADLILFIYRDEVYNEETADKGKAEIIIGKHRNGRTDKFNLTFQGEYVRFRDFTFDHHGLDG